VTIERLLLSARRRITSARAEDDIGISRHNENASALGRGMQPVARAERQLSFTSTAPRKMLASIFTLSTSKWLWLPGRACNGDRAREGALEVGSVEMRRNPEHVLSDLVK
jgi:hypothetical protein